MTKLGRTHLSRIVVGVIAVVLLGGCQYWQEGARYWEGGPGGPVPWFCNPTAANSVTGPGMGTVNWYQGDTRAPMAGHDCALFGAQLDQSKAVATSYPTLGVAEAAGFDRAFAFIPGMGTHHAFQGITPELLQDPSFNRLDPVIPGSVLDESFDPSVPEFLQFNGNSPESRLVGMSWYVRTDDGQPPEGFDGNNDWWHHHPWLCVRTSTAEVINVNASDSTCTAQNGTNLYMADYYMLHTWQVDDLEYRADVFAPMHPCILSTGAVFDMDDACHDNYQPAAAQPQEARAATASDPAAAAFCQLFQIGEQQSTKPQKPAAPPG